MTDLGQVVEVRETTSAEEANRLRNAGWIVMGLSQGTRENGEAYLLYSLGWTGSNPVAGLSRGSFARQPMMEQGGSDNDPQPH